MTNQHKVYPAARGQQIKVFSLAYYKALEGPKYGVSSRTRFLEHHSNCRIKFHYHVAAKLMGHLASVQPPPPHLVAGSPRWSSQSGLKPERQPLHL